MPFAIVKFAAVGMRVEVDKAKEATAVMFFRRENLPPEILHKVIEIRRLLKLPEGQQKFNVAYSPAIGAEDELAAGSRSMLQIMLAFASCADVPEQDLKEQRALVERKLAVAAQTDTLL
jgi:hypothetical protein